MQTEAFIIVSQNGGVKVAKRAFRLNNDELAFRLRIEVADDAFADREQVIEVKLTRDQLIAAPITADVIGKNVG